MIENKINQDLREAMLNKEALLVSTLRGLKSVILYFKIDNGGKRDQTLSDQDMIRLLLKESKKRQESADLYKQGGNQEKADKELAEKTIIDSYLPEQIDPQKLQAIVNSVVSDFSDDKTKIGAIIAEVKNRTNGRAEGFKIAELVKEHFK